MVRPLFNSDCGGFDQSRHVGHATATAHSGRLVGYGQGSEGAPLAPKLNTHKWKYSKHDHAQST